MEITKDDIDRMYRVSLTALCGCFDHANKGTFYPTNCDCDKREQITKAISLINEEHKRLIDKLKRKE